MRLRTPVLMLMARPGLPARTATPLFGPRLSCLCNVRISLLRDLRDVVRQDLVDSYLKPFQACVEKGRVSSLMCSYVPHLHRDHRLTQPHQSPDRGAK